LVTDVSGQPIGPSSRAKQSINVRCVTSQKSEYLMYTAAKPEVSQPDESFSYPIIGMAIIIIIIIIITIIIIIDVLMCEHHGRILPLISLI
jgi:hypothetical protein